MNIRLIKLLKNTINAKGIKYAFISQKLGIDYQRLMRIFNQNAIITGYELILLCKLLDINLTDLVDLIDDVA